MSEKPSLYVVEKKEVIILVVLFVLVTVLSFTLGVRYGESVGKKVAHQEDLASREQGGADADGGAGTLGKTEAHSDEAGSLEKHDETKPEPKAGSPSGTAPAAEHGAEAKGKEEKAETKGESHSPEDAAKHAATSVSHEAVDKNSDEYLLNALKDAGVEPPGGKAPQDAKLPESVKEAPAPRASAKARSGTYVIQVGSHPTQGEAESQVRSLRARKVQAEILPPFKDKQGEWHRVVIGGFKSKRDAEKEASGLKGKGSILSYFVWRLP